MTTEEEAELRRYAELLAWIMHSENDREEVRETAVHVWRVELTLAQHEQLQRFYNIPEEDDDD